MNYGMNQAQPPKVEKRPASDSYDDDLYHRALTGRGDPIRPEEVLELLEALEVQVTDARLEDEREQKRETERAKEHEELETKHSAAVFHCGELNEELANLRSSFALFRTEQAALEAQHAVLKAAHEELQAEHAALKAPVSARTKRKGWRP